MARLWDLENQSQSSMPWKSVTFFTGCNSSADAQPLLVQMSLLTVITVFSLMMHSVWSNLRQCCLLHLEVSRNWVLSSIVVVLVEVLPLYRTTQHFFFGWRMGKGRRMDCKVLCKSFIILYVNCSRWLSVLSLFYKNRWPGSVTVKCFCPRWEQARTTLPLSPTLCWGGGVMLSSLWSPILSWFKCWLLMVETQNVTHQALSPWGSSWLPLMLTGASFGTLWSASFSPIWTLCVWGAYLSIPSGACWIDSVLFCLSGWVGSGLCLSP